ncbi:DNA helicase PcrA [Agrilactobacillus yilanensis]|uniref:ATP-dependent DNA helicase n=1 Tax=Agrilactobacillus yilanensis TaxID=2485997 RepID=A0ABW4J9B0_9LACO|nr:DNA helicase PcrA [Agrilactobacillus yilanensis]
MAIDLLDKLNDKQQEAVRTTEGPLLIMAGAGSGKTRVLTHRVAYLIEEKGVNPWNVLAITFTNKAAREMKERVGQLLNADDAQAVWVSTFHALCVRILRRESEKIGYARSFTIADPAEQLTLIKRILKNLNLDPKKFEPRSILGAISNAKNQLITPKEFHPENLFEKTVAQVYERYQASLQADQAMDFDDLIMLTIQLFESDRTTLSYYQNKFHYIHVDEYQDTNEAQYQLVKLLAGQYHNLCVVGDADQSIYGWRGANMNNILDFEKDYSDAKVVMLEQNYRSTKHILKAANEVIQHNVVRRPKDLWTDNTEGEKITYYRGQSGQDEAIYVIQQIQAQIKDKHYRYGDFAILYRTNAQSRIVEESLLKANMPYKIVGGHKFYDRKEIKDVLAYLRLVANPKDDMSFQRVINVPKRGIGPGTIDKLQDFADLHDFSLLEACLNIDLANITGRANGNLADFGNMIYALRQRIEAQTLTQLTEDLLDRSGYLAALKKQNNLESASRIENIEELLSVTQQFDDHYEPEDEDSDKFVDFLADLALVSDQDDLEEAASEVTLMTLHAAKGLEFPVVFLIGLEDGIFPMGRALTDQDELEEERRLAYVGITRAREKLYITNAYSRMLYGRTQSNPASRFISEINDNLIENANRNAGAVPFRKPGNSRLANQYERSQATAYQAPGAVAKTSDAGGKTWLPGDKVTHKKWGIGTVVKVNGTGENAELDIAFKEQGVKRLLAAFAPIQKVKAED